MYAVRSTSLLPVRSRTALALLAVAAVLLTLLQAGSAPRADALGVSPQVDPPSQYEAQVTCTSKPRPGTVALAHYLLRAYPVTRSMGLMRGCSVGGTSEHKDGRAFDWGADVAHARTRAAAYAFIDRVLATDSHGNAHALARRMGIMYIIYNDTIWGSYRDFAPRKYLNPACKSLSTCSRTLRHKDHVHISLGYSGAAAQTSWYRARGVPSQPVFYPGTRELDPNDTAVTGFKVPATGVLTAAPFLLRGGVTYRVVATGTVRYGADTVGDASCVRTPIGSLLADRGDLLGGTDPGTDPDPDPGDGWGGWGGGIPTDYHADSPAFLPLPTTHGLIFAKALRWEGGCSPSHTYEAWYTPTVTQRLYFKYADLTPDDNAGTINVYIARDDITLSSLTR
jgi:hypothetical protein